MPRLIVGLGNPGPEYERTRHNAGFWLAEKIAHRAGLSVKRESRFHGLAGKLDGAWVLLPQTYMNRSGVSVSALTRFYRIEPAEILVLHDELDLPPGALRLKFGGGSGGHNGLKDIAAHLGTQDFWRLRIGIGHPGNRAAVVDYVLKSARLEEQIEIDRALDRAMEDWSLIERGDFSSAMQKFNVKVVTPTVTNRDT